MSLLLIGYDKQQSMHSALFGEKDDYTVQGIFAVADSGISRGVRQAPLLTEFDKISEIEAKVKFPNFVGDQFNGFGEVIQRQKFLIGFAGSTLVAQHVLTKIRAHVEDLHLGAHERSNGVEEISYDIFMPCQKSPVAAPNRSWDESTFTSPRLHCDNLTIEKLIKIVEHSVKAGLIKAAEHDLLYAKTEFFFACNNVSNDQYSIYHINFTGNKINDLKVQSVLLPIDQLLILGIKKFEEQLIRDYSVLDVSSRPSFAHSEINKAIFDFQQNGNNALNYPAISWNLRRGVITRKQIKK